MQEKGLKEKFEVAEEAIWRRTKLLVDQEDDSSRARRRRMTEGISKECRSSRRSRWTNKNGPYKGANTGGQQQLRSQNSEQTRRIKVVGHEERLSHEQRKGQCTARR